MGMGALSFVSAVQTADKERRRISRADKAMDDCADALHSRADMEWGSVTRELIARIECPRRFLIGDVCEVQLVCCVHSPLVRLLPEGLRFKMV